jgi:hypothetical protein
MWSPKFYICEIKIGFYLIVKPVDGYIGETRTTIMWLYVIYRFIYYDWL